MTYQNFLLFIRIGFSIALISLGGCELTKLLQPSPTPTPSQQPSPSVSLTPTTPQPSSEGSIPPTPVTLIVQSKAKLYLQPGQKGVPDPSNSQKSLILTIGQAVELQADPATQVNQECYVKVNVSIPNVGKYLGWVNTIAVDSPKSCNSSQ